VDNPRSLSLAELLAMTVGRASGPEVQWSLRTVQVPGPDGVREMEIEAPADWSDASLAVVAGSYLAPRRETSVRQLIERVVTTAGGWTVQAGHVQPEQREAFQSRLRQILVRQRASFNSPVYYNLGIPGRRQQAAACYLLDVQDDLPSILNWYREEGLIFQGGAGAGVNLSRLRAACEPLSAGGTSSGPVSFMRGADASAGTIKSGGSTRRAAKMVVLDVDHPDIEDFIWCKALEERKARVLRDAGFDMSLGGKDSFSIQYQNANNSVRVTDEFMRAVVEDRDWHLRARTSGEVVKTLRARDLFRQIAQAAWECGDPGVQFDDTINKGNTTPRSGGRIRTTNPCGETHLGPNQSCNLASINLPRYLLPGAVLDLRLLLDDIDTLICAMDAIALLSDYPTEAIERNARRHRPLGLGFTGLGELLIRLAIPYDSDEARDLAGALAHLLTAAAWHYSAQLAVLSAPFDSWDEDQDAALGVLARHAASAAAGLERSVLPLAREVWKEAVAQANKACELAQVTGLRNTQVTAVAPTGTISWLMGAQTTGVEPAFALRASKRLVDGRVVPVPLPCIEEGLRRLGCSDDQVRAALDAVEKRGNLAGVISDEHLPVFATAVGPHAISPEAHVRMLAAVQAGISQGVSKTVNLPADATVEDIEAVLCQAWRLGVKAVAVYRDGCKVSQPLNTGSAHPAATQAPVRRRMPEERAATTYTIHAGNTPVYVTVGWHSDGQPGELFLRAARSGSTVGGLLDTLAVTASLALQYGCPVDDLLRHWKGTRFEPAGWTGNPQMPFVTSIPDGVARRLGIALGKATDGPPPALTSGDGADPTPAAPGGLDVGAPPCACGGLMVRTGTCWSCPSCGASGGCG
jgi:ribonucleoside-diphosphate reductase alpha chain